MTLSAVLMLLQALCTSGFRIPTSPWGEVDGPLRGEADIEDVLEQSRVLRTDIAVSEDIQWFRKSAL